jgi:serine phosphatase RsbU (regulator of sigma subunit)
MSVRFCSLRAPAVTGALAATALGLSVPAASALGAPVPSLGSGALVSIGPGSSPVPALPSIKVELPAPSGGAPLAEIGVAEKGVTAATPVLPPVEVPVTKAEVPKAPTVPSVPSVPNVPSVPSVPAGPPVGTITNPTGGTGGSSGGSGSGGGSVRTAPSSGASAAASSKSVGSAPTGASNRHAVKATNAKGAAAGRGTGLGGGSGAGATGGAPGASGTAGDGATRPAGRGGTSGSAPQAKHATRDPLSSLGHSLPLPLPVPDWSKPIILALALLAIGFGARSRLATRRAGRLERRQDSLLRDIEAMQAALVPDVPGRLGGLAVSVAYRPAEGPAAGGDFYDVLAIGPDRVAVILGDVAGHGHDALRQAALTRYTLRAFLKETEDPRATLSLAGHALSEPGFEQLATVAIAIFDSTQGTLTYALAGHPPPIVLGVTAGEVPACCSSPPVGCDMPTGRRQRTVTLPAGARACFFSDGLIEARRSATPPGGHPDLLGRDRLRELLIGLPKGAGAEQLLGAVREDATATPDDMAACILTSEVRAGGDAVDIEELEVDRGALDGGHLEAYLHASGLDDSETTRVLAAAAARLDAHDTAVLVVDRGGTEPDVSIVAGVERRGGDALRRRTEPDPPRLLRA